jgi:hypothetical protein
MKKLTKEEMIKEQKLLEYFELKIEDSATD